MSLYRCSAAPLYQGAVARYNRPLFSLRSKAPNDDHPNRTRAGEPMSRRVNLVTRHFVLIASVLAAASGSLMAQQAAPAGWADFTKIFDTAMDHDRVTGAGIVVLRDGN